ncbi:stonustoxin subunit beta-like [Scomber scombrus]|uniref:Stonustoxin subunit beta-like n=1 Tax=Scomber scombrus TaxID=13677 RepID=A0AAV1Q2D3_SCOSC
MTTSYPIEMAALGRPFTLGMLYDTRKGVLVPGFTLWDTKTLQENTVDTTQRCSDFHITSSDSMESKSFLLDIEASLKLSFLGGLIEVGGSAKYLNDQKKFKNQSRVTLQYKTTTNFKQLSMNKFAILDEQQKDDIEKSSATHVVTGILYGANAVFVFDSEKLEASSVQEIQGHMEAVIKKIPAFDIQGRVSIKLTDKEKALTKKFSCKFFGDLILESNPATFEEAVNTYVELPKLLGEKKENAVPLKVWLMPLKNFDSKAAELKAEVSTGLVKNVENTVEDLGTVEMRLNDSLADRVSKNFPQIRKSLTSFQRQRNNYTSGLQQAMAKTVISIHEGKEDESSLKKLLEDREKSPFSHEKLSKWLDHKEREINVIGSCVDMMKGTNTKIVPNQSELDEEVLAPGVEDALCFVFTSLESADGYLKAMQNYSHSLELKSSDEEPWYFSNEVLTKMREKAKAFHDLAKPLKNSSSVRFLATAIANEKHKGATIYHYKEGILVTDDFSKPAVPPFKTITDKSALMWCPSLWDRKTLQENTTETSHHSSNFQVTSSDSIESKSSLLDVEASLKASFLGGLIEVGGSAKYLNDQKKFKNHSRVTFQYKATTNFKQLSMNKFAILDEQQKVDIEKSSATHVVTGMLYGANAVFVFDSDKLDASSVQEIQGHMEAVIKKIPSFDVEGKVDIKMTKEEKALTEKFSCKFYGDLILERNPATFVEAVKTYVELPKLLGEKKENAVPLKVWLMPLKNFDIQRC